MARDSHSRVMTYDDPHSFFMWIGRHFPQAVIQNLQIRSTETEFKHQVTSKNSVALFMTINVDQPGKQSNTLQEVLRSSLSGEIEYRLNGSIYLGHIETIYKAFGHTLILYNLRTLHPTKYSLQIPEILYPQDFLNMNLSGSYVLVGAIMHIKEKRHYVAWCRGDDRLWYYVDDDDADGPIQKEKALRKINRGRATLLVYSYLEPNRVLEYPSPDKVD